MKTDALALMEAASPDLEKQGFLSVVFLNREYNGQQETAPKKSFNPTQSKMHYFVIFIPQIYFYEFF